MNTQDMSFVTSDVVNTYTMYNVYIMFDHIS